jgi:hypothetical protein
MKVEELPAVVIKELELIFSLYSHNHPDKRVRRMQEKFIAYDIGTDYGSENCYLETKDGSLAATYNGNGKLIRVVENYKMYDCLMR